MMCGGALNIDSRHQRVASFQRNTLNTFFDMVGAMGLVEPLLEPVVSTTDSGHQRLLSDENTRRKYQIQKGRVPRTLTLLKLLPQ